MNEELLKIRHYLHSTPELSGLEANTSAFIFTELEKTKPDMLIKNAGGYGIIANYKGKKKGKSIAIRADFDALPIKEEGNLYYKSRNEGVSHACGHDGHTTIALGLAQYLLSINKDFCGDVTLIFQAEEETGSGADKMLKKTKLADYDFIFALHNLPGFEKNALIVRDNVFASSSIGVKIRLYGATSHAGHPENGNSPLAAMLALINSLQNLPHSSIPMHKSALVTIIHCRLGEVAFGTSPGYSEVMATLRAYNTEDIETMKNKLEDLIQGLAQTYKLKCETEWVEFFPATVNDKQCVDTLRAVADNLKLKLIEKDFPFAWSEDFAYFTQKYKGMLFGLGAGINHPQVHNSDYNFPDELIDTGLRVFLELINYVNGNL